MGRNYGLKETVFTAQNNRQEKRALTGFAQKHVSPQQEIVQTHANITKYDKIKEKEEKSITIT